MHFCLLGFLLPFTHTPNLLQNCRLHRTVEGTILRNIIQEYKARPVVFAFHRDNLGEEHWHISGEGILARFSCAECFRLAVQSASRGAPTILPTIGASMLKVLQVPFGVKIWIQLRPGPRWSKRKR